ncbi:PH domain-containing protein [Actinokineospora sp.]|uniref:PH domain-containing protein n=1 Tax=Actinokineospora sp. TaxID=1872133 RepID=UPI004037C66F
MSQTATAVDPALAADDEVPWQRLHIRVVWVDAVKLLVSMLPSVLATVVFDLDFSSGTFGLWPVIVVSALGAFSSLNDLLRWWKTRYRVTADRVEIHAGKLVRKHRSVPRDRIRTVDTHARLRHRLSGLRVVSISSGEARQSFKLDALDKRAAAELRRELLGNQAADDEAASPARDEDVIARFRWSWIFYNIFSIWALPLGALMLWSAYWAFQVLNVDLLVALNSLIGWNRLGVWWSIGVGVGGTFLVGFLAMALGFVSGNWKFHLVHTTTDGGSALLSRQGLLKTREVYREDKRLRGIHISQPLFWRWIGLTETEVISTGLSSWSGGEMASTILPRAPIGEARRVARLVLPDGARPLEAPLRRHPRTALYRRLVWALTVPAILTAALAVLGSTGALPAWVWLIAAAMPVVTVPLAVVAYRSLGHTLDGEYLVLRCGLSRQTTAALQRQAIIGWKLRRSPVQRLFRLMTVGVSTAAGTRYYQAPDIAVKNAISFTRESTPDLVAQFLECPTRNPPPDREQVKLPHKVPHRGTAADSPTDSPGEPRSPAREIWETRKQ